MTATLRCGAFVGVVALSTACSHADRHPAPSPLPTPSAIGPPPPVFEPRVFPPLIGPSNTYVFSGDLERRASYSTVNSQYVLYENGAVSLQYLALGTHMEGSYLLQDGRISFSFSSGVDASGTLNGEVLEIRYSDRMHQIDFEDAVYKRFP